MKASPYPSSHRPPWSWCPPWQNWQPPGPARALVARTPEWAHKTCVRGGAGGQCRGKVLILVVLVDLTAPRFSVGPWDAYPKACRGRSNSMHWDAGWEQVVCVKVEAGRVEGEEKCNGWGAHHVVAYNSAASVRRFNTHRPCVLKSGDKIHLPVAPCSLHRPTYS